MSTLYKNSFTARDENSRFIIGLVAALTKDQDQYVRKTGEWWYFRVTKIEETDDEIIHPITKSSSIYQSATVVFETDEDYEVFYNRLKKALRRSDGQHAYKTVATLKPTAEFDGDYNDFWNSQSDN